jgi:hypothetical protein
MSGPAISKIGNNPVFAPTQINGCTLWLDSADPATYTVLGSNVTRWRDKTSSIAFQGSQIAPTLSVTKYNTLPSMYFGGGSYFQNASFTFTTSSRTTFFVFDENVETNNAGVLSFAASGTDFNQLNTMAYETGLKSSNQYLQIVQGQGVGGYALQIQATSIGYAMYSDTFGSGTETAYVNGSQTATTSNASAFTNSTGLVIGARMITNSISNFLNGVIGEVILYNRPLSTSERQQVEGYLAWKWGLQGNLPTAHPYKNSPFPGLSSAPIPSFPPLTLNNPLFVPTQLNGCQLWFDAADMKTFTLMGSNITQWRDKSSNAYTIGQSSSQLQPFYRYPIQNGFGGVQLTTQRYIFTASSNMPNFTTSSETSVFIAARNGTSGTGFNVINTVWLSGASALTTRYQLNFDRDTGSLARGVNLYLSGAFRLQNTTNAIPAATAGVVGFTASASSILLSENGYTTTAAGVAPTPANDATYFQFGDSRGVSTLSSDVVIFEMVGYNRQVTAAERQQIEGYLAWKWGTQASLPTTHPYYKSPFPTVSYAPIPVLPPQIRSASFSPRQISGIQLWLDAADRATITGVSPVTGWTDKSGTSKTVSFVNTNTYNSSTQSINTTNSPVTYFTANIDLRYSQVTYATVFIVHTWTGSSVAASANQALWGQDNSGGWNRFQLLSFPAAPSIAYGLSHQPALPNVTVVSALNTANRVVYSATYASGFGGGTFAYVNGSLASATVTEVAPSPQTPITYTYFGSIDSGYSGRVAFHEIIIYTTEITRGQRQSVEGYLAWKWGLQGSLPGNHPYRLFPPSPA